VRVDYQEFALYKEYKRNADGQNIIGDGSQ